MRKVYGPKRVIPIAAPSLGEEEWRALREPLESGWLTQGPKVKAFEEAFANRHRVEHALATTSCTTALHLALAALGIGPGDEVIVPAFLKNVLTVTRALGEARSRIRVGRPDAKADRPLRRDRQGGRGQAVRPANERTRLGP